MKYAEYILDNNTIEFLNNPFTGVETILLNGKKVSDKFSFFGGKHSFKIKEEEYTLQVGIDFLKAGGASSSIYKGLNRIDLINKISKAQKWILNIRFALVCIVSGAIGGCLGFYGMESLLDLIL